MKKLLVLFLAICVMVACFVVVPTAAAEEGLFYVVSEGQEVYLQYAKMDDSTFQVSRAKVLLPAGYTVQTKVAGTNIKVSYMGIEDFYITQADLEKMTVSPSEKALPEIAVKVDDLYLYRFTADEKIEAYGSIPASAELTYLGSYTYNSLEYYAVSMKGEEGVYYTLASHSNAAEINAILHPNANTSIISAPETGSDKTSDKKEGGFTWVRFVLILGIIVPLITIVLMIIRPSAARRRAHREIYDDDDDYDGIDEV